MSLFELPGIFPKAAQKLALKSPQRVNAETMIVEGRAGKETVSRAFYLSALRHSYWNAGFIMLGLTALVAVIFRENAPGYVIFTLWGLAFGFMMTSIALDYRMMKFQLLFADKPTQKQLNDALQKTPSNLVWILSAVIAGGLPWFLIEVLPMILNR